jgi:hypothetical protein
VADDPLIDDALGPLDWDEGLEWWTGVVELGAGRRVRAHVSTMGDDVPSLPIVMERARRSLDRLRGQEDSYRRSAAGDLLAVHNGSWNDDEPIDEQEFIERMALESVTFYPDGSIELCYADGDLFWGHVILMSVAADGTVGKATIAG